MTPTIEDIRGAVARGWCHDANATKTVDVDLAEAIAQEVLKAMQGEVDQRQRFENYMRATRTHKGVKWVDKLLARNPGGDYAEVSTERHWWTWQNALGLTRHAKDQGQWWRPLLTHGLEARVRELFNGINQAEVDDDAGWWETSKGAEFGAGKLRDLLQLLRDVLAEQTNGSVNIDLKQATELMAMFGGEPTEITLSEDSVSLKAHYTEYPEEGSVDLGKSDPEATP